MVRFIAIHGGTVTSPIFVIDHKDNFTIQMYVNGTAQLCAQTTNTVATGNDKAPLSFVTLVQVNNSCCSVNNNQTLTFVAPNAVSGTITHANVSIIRL